MKTGAIISISIILASILLIIIISSLTYKKIKPTINNMNNLSEDLNQKINSYTKDGENLNQKVAALNQKANTLQSNLEQKSAQFQDFAETQEQFQDSLLYLKNHSGEYTKGISSNLKEEIKEDGPKITETFKRTFKKTFKKQKLRYQK